MKKLFLLLIVVIIFTGCEKNDFSMEEKNAQKIADEINSYLAEIQTQIEELAFETKRIYKEKEFIIKNIRKENYAIAPSGVMYKKLETGSSLYVSTVKEATDNVREIAYVTEELDNPFRKIVLNTPEIVQVYFNNKENINRLYPFINVLTDLAPNLDITNFNFYYEADPNHNPERKSIWISPYIDPAGRGRIISSIHPVYTEDGFEGVVGGDIPLAELNKKFFNNLTEKFILLNRNGQIIGISSMITKIISIPPVTKSYNYPETIKENTFLEEEFNLLRNRSRDIRSMAMKMVDSDFINQTFTIDEKKYYVIKKNIEITDWILFSFTSL